MILKIIVARANVQFCPLRKKRNVASAALSATLYNNVLEYELETVQTVTTDVTATTEGRHRYNDYPQFRLKSMNFRDRPL